MTLVNKKAGHHYIYTTSALFANTSVFARQLFLDIEPGKIGDLLQPMIGPLLKKCLNHSQFQCW